MLKKILIIFNVSIFFFFILNFLVVLTWPIYAKSNKDKHNYIEEQIELLGLNNDQLITLYNETWENYDKFRFIPFMGHTETERKGSFVNFDEENGRKVVRPSTCETNIYLYGGSTTFGYNVTDNQTIGQEMQNALPNNYCIYNHGRAYFYSKQENNLFFSHLENKKKIHKAIFLDGVNERCGSYEYANHLYKSFSLLVERPYLMWKKTSTNFLYSLPVVQFANAIKHKNRFVNDNNNNILKVSSCENKIPINELFQTRVNQRHGVCTSSNIECFSFLQPMAGSHGVQINKLTRKNHTHFIKKYQKLKESKKNIIDLGYVFNEDIELSYIDGIHYSALSNRKIAKELLKIVIN